MDLSRILHLSRLVRLPAWIHLTGLCGLGVAAGYAAGGSLFPVRTVALMICAALYLAHGYALNDYFDFRVSGTAAPARLRQLLTAALALFAANAALSLSIGPVILLLTTAGMLLGVAYVAPPLRLKRFILPNYLLNSAGFSLLFVMGYAGVRDAVPPEAAGTGAFIFLLFIPLQVAHHIAHRRDDLKLEVDNLCTRAGTKRTAVVMDLSLLALLPGVFLLPLSATGRALLLAATGAFGATVSLRMHGCMKGKEIDARSGLFLRLYVRRAGILYGVAMGMAFAIDRMAG